MSVTLQSIETGNVETDEPQGTLELRIIIFLQRRANHDSPSTHATCQLQMRAKKISSVRKKLSNVSYLAPWMRTTFS